MRTLESARAAYIALLALPPAGRLPIQAELCDLRDWIAETSGRTSKEVQDECESLALEVPWRAKR